MLPELCHVAWRIQSRSCASPVQWPARQEAHAARRTQALQALQPLDFYCWHTRQLLQLHRWKGLTLAACASQHQLRSPHRADTTRILLTQALADVAAAASGNETNLFFPVTVAALFGGAIGLFGPNWLKQNGKVGLCHLDLKECILELREKLVGSFTS